MSALKRIIYNCQKATYLADKKMNGRISVKEQFELNIHLIRCDMCKRYIKQSKKINEMITILLKSPLPTYIRLDDRFKTELQVRIDKEINKN